MCSILDMIVNDPNVDETFRNVLSCRMCKYASKKENYYCFCKKKYSKVRYKDKVNCNKFERSENGN